MSDYELLDFGQGRKLERLGDVVLDRICPAAEGTRFGNKALWRDADLRLDREGNTVAATAAGKRLSSSEPGLWRIEIDGVIFGLRLTPFGHVGLFPEQRDNWRWITELCGKQIEVSKPVASLSPVRCLNLFAYTGGTTMFLAKAGASVVHVDSSQPSVAWARSNAALNDLADAPVRWIVDDARKFVSRELKRGNRYELVVLDPPSFGHGLKGQRWDLGEDLPALLDDCAELLADGPAHILLTGHSLHPSDKEIAGWLRESVRRCGRQQAGRPRFGRLALSGSSSANLDAGFYLRFAVQ